MNSILRKYKVDVDRIVEYGFVLEGKDYVYKRDINDSLYVKIVISGDTLDMDVYEREDDTLYLPFRVKDNIGCYVAGVREICDKVLEEVVERCFKENKIRDEIAKFIYQEWKVEGAYLWEGDDVTCVFRNSSNKWFAIYMEIPYKKLGLDIDGIVGIINVKSYPDVVEELIDNVMYFSAYHMNKKHWLTILLDNSSKLEEIKKLIRESYGLVSRKSCVKN